MHKVNWHVFSTAILASAWIACNKMRNVWTSKLPWATKIRLVRAIVESVLLYGSETWTVTTKLEEKCQWMLCQNAGNSPEWVLATAYEQPGAIQEPTKSYWNNPCMKIKRLFQKRCFGNPNMVTQIEVDLELYTLTPSRLILVCTIPKR